MRAERGVELAAMGGREEEGEEEDEEGEEEEEEDREGETDGEGSEADEEEEEEEEEEEMVGYTQPPLAMHGMVQMRMVCAGLTFQVYVM